MGRPKGLKRISSRDNLILQGLSLGKIAKREGVSRQAVHMYINRTDQYETWREARGDRYYRYTRGNN